MGFRTDNISNNNRPLQDFGGDNYSLYFAGNTGIGNGNYPAFADIGKSKFDVDNYFQGKMIDLPEYADALQELSEIKIGQAFGRPNQVHISVPWKVLSNKGIEYICFSGKKWDDLTADPARTYYARIVDFATVNSNSTRITFQMDYVASYWDMLDLSPETGLYGSIVRRSEASCADDPDFDAPYTSTQTDGLSFQTQEWKYDIQSIDNASDLSGGVRNFAQKYPKASTLELMTRSLFDIKTSKAVVLSQVNFSGELHEIVMNFQSGSNIGGFLYAWYLDGTALQNFMNNVSITFSNTAWSMGQPFLSVVKGMYLVPQEVADNCSPKPAYVGQDNQQNAYDYSETQRDRDMSDGWQAWKDLVSNLNVSTNGDTNAMFPGAVSFGSNPKQALRWKANMVLHNKESLSNMLGLKGNDALQNNKIMNYITYTLRTALTAMTFTPFCLNMSHAQITGYGQRPVAEMVFEMFGGANGSMKTTLLTRGYDYTPDKEVVNWDNIYNVSLSPYSISTPQWPTLSVAGTQSEHLKTNGTGYEPTGDGRGRGDKGGDVNPKTGGYDKHYHPGWGDKHNNWGF